ncbi:MAG TPA: HAD-IIA family hydrolase [Pseudolysinimonas sp.]|nr:HAD-IIA family hydrolase [Pseudolysinimonas sp.]
MRRRHATNAATPLDGVDVVFADLDGVVYAGDTALPYAVESINRIQNSARVAYITNNASRTAQTVAEHLAALGLRVVANDVVTSPQAAIVLLAELVPAGSTVLVVGGDGLTTVVEQAGFVVTRRATDSPAAVVQGFAPTVSWTELAEASYALRSDGSGDGIPWIATNTDWTIPQERGTAPGNGTLVAAVHTAVGRLPIVAGKPERAIFDAAVARFEAQNPLFLGDRLDTDILGARRAGIRSAFVLTGVDGPKQVLAAAENSRPDYILGDLREAFEPYPEQVETRERRTDDRIFHSGDAVVRLSGSRVSVEAAGTRASELLRAGAAAVWGAGVPIHALQVDPGLYS